jgi:hypothetical protein
MNTINPSFRDAAINAARAYWCAHFGPGMPSSAWADVGHAVAFEAASPAAGYWRDPEFDAWADAWDKDGNPVNHCGEWDYANRLTESLDYARLHFRA